MTRSVAVIGAGVMGAGIAQVVLEAGDAVTLHDPDPAAMERARGRITDGLMRRARKVDGGDAWVSDHLARLEVAPSSEAAAREADIVIEAAIEDLEAKRTLFRALDGAAPPDVILATNTSALRVADIAAAVHRPERVLGLHWFNPAPVMALVEVVPTELTDPAVIERAMALVAAWGKTPVRSADTPGFIVNRVNRPFTIEALRLVEAGAADIATIDAAMRAAGFPMGPFELMDLAGLDVNLAAARGVWEGLGRPERLRPSPLQQRLVAAGHLGRKTGEGFYRYAADGTREPADAFATTVRPGTDSVHRAEIVARITAAIDAEAERAAAEGVASRDDIELALRLGAGHPLRSTP
jgi:3-hydroxybutyryl-CoA dehydrogenase